MAQDTAGFEIRDRFYPAPERFRAGDPVLVEQLTNLKFEEWAERLDDMRGGEGIDPVILPGLLGVAVWQVNTRWKREKVVRFVEGIDLDEITFNAGDDADDEEAITRPPAEGSSTSAPTSTKQAEEPA